MVYAWETIVLAVDDFWRVVNEQHKENLNHEQGEAYWMSHDEFMKACFIEKWGYLALSVKDLCDMAESEHKNKVNLNYFSRANYFYNAWRNHQINNIKLFYSEARQSNQRDEYAKKHLLPIIEQIIETHAGEVFNEFHNLTPVAWAGRLKVFTEKLKAIKH